MDSNSKATSRQGTAACQGPLLATHGFTLLELLITAAIIALLAALLLPALAKAKTKGQSISCLNNLKQLGLGIQMYAAENDGRLPENLPGNPTDSSKTPWVTGNMATAQEATNNALIRAGRLFPYIRQVPVYHCASDLSTAQGRPRTRSYSMNSWIGSRWMEKENGTSTFRTFIRDSELAAAGAARLWVLMDEHENTIDDAWFLVTMDDTRPFLSSPATRHQQGYNLGFADGHAEHYRLREPQLVAGSAQTSKSAEARSDWLRLKEITTLR